MFSFTIPGKPHGKERPRFSRSHVYTPKNTVKYETLVQLAFRREYPDRMPYEKNVPICVEIVAHFKRPKKPNASEFVVKKPDIDNIAKSVCDALNGVAYYDDAQISTLIVKKRYANEESVTVTVKKEN